jgi:hypothetical protein
VIRLKGVNEGKKAAISDQYVNFSTFAMKFRAVRSFRQRLRRRPSAAYGEA